jgi:uncharacterized protein (DUF2384 family)
VTLSEVLRRPTTHEDTLKVLRDTVGFSDQEIARALRVTDRSVKRWRAGEAISTESLETLFDLARVVSSLADLGLPAPNVRAWFFHRNRFLEEQRPIEVFAEHGFDAVYLAVAAIADGAYA